MNGRTGVSRRAVLGTLAAVGTAGCAGRTADGSVGLNGVEELAVTFSAGNLQLVGTDETDELLVQGVPIQDGVWETVKALVDAVVDAILRNEDPEGVTATYEDGTLRLTTGERFANVTADVELRVPRTLTVRSVTTGEGDVRLTGTRGSTTVETGRGDVTVLGVSGTPTVQTGAGDVTVENTDGVGGVRTAEGQVTADVRAVPGDTVIRSNDGGVTTRVSPTLPARLDAEATDGTVTVASELTESRTTDTDSRVVGPVEQPADSLLRVASGDGPVEVRQL